MADKYLRKSVHINEISEAAVAGVQGREFYHDPVMLKECLDFREFFVKVFRHAEIG